MSNYYQNPNVVNVAGYEIYFTRFADSIIKDHFRDAESELSTILENFRISPSQIILGGGGLSTITQSLGRLLNDKGWVKRNIESVHSVGEKILTSESHEVDHYKNFEQGNLGLEIEWNNKDPFFDRDLENFRKLHQIGELSVGIIITRGASLQTELGLVYERFISILEPFSFDNLQTKFANMSTAAKSDCQAFFNLPKEQAVKRIASLIYSSKYGTATTHMSKLLVRLTRGVGNPCPFILIGIGKDRLINDGQTIQ